MIVFRTDGVNEFIGSIANRDPYRFLHRTRFGVSGAQDMPIGRDLGWNTSESVDLLAFAQRLPTGVEIVQGTNAGTGSKPSPNLGGPQGGIVGGFFTGFAAVFGMLGFSFSFLFLLVIFGALIVWALRKRN